MEIIEPNPIVLDLGCGIGGSRSSLHHFVRKYMPSVSQVDDKLVKKGERKMFSFTTNGRDLAIFLITNSNLVLNTGVATPSKGRPLYIFWKYKSSKTRWKGLSPISERAP